MKYLLSPDEKRLLQRIFFSMTRRLPFPRWQRERIADEHAARATARIENGEAEALVKAISEYASASDATRGQALQTLATQVIAEPAVSTPPASSTTPTT